MNSILRSYIPVAEMISNTLGSLCEVVIHNLTQPQNSVVYVTKNNVTGRKTGQSFEHLVKQVLLNKNFKNDYLANYYFEIDNKVFKSSSALIRNSKKEVIGMLCINIEIDQLLPLKDFLNNITYIEQEDSLKDKAEELEEVDKIIDKLISNIIGNKDLAENNRRQNIEIIRFMESKGIFLVKGAIDKVAKSMNVSKVTIYSYLDEIKKEVE